MSTPNDTGRPGFTPADETPPQALTAARRDVFRLGHRHLDERPGRVRRHHRQYRWHGQCRLQLVVHGRTGSRPVLRVPDRQHLGADVKPIKWAPALALVGLLAAGCGAATSTSAGSPPSAPATHAAVTWTPGGTYTGPIPPAGSMPGSTNTLQLRPYTNPDGYKIRDSITFGCRCTTQSRSSCLTAAVLPTSSTCNRARS
jgi:hypothetical protein